MNRLQKRAYDNFLAVTIPSDTRYLHAITNLASNVGNVAGLDASAARDLSTAVVEAVTNVIDHAYQGAADKVIDIEFHVTPGKLEVHVLHSGLPIDETQIEPYDPATDPTRLKTRGYGVFLMRHLADRVDYRQTRDGRHECCLVKYVKEDDDQSGVSM